MCDNCGSTESVRGGLCAECAGTMAPLIGHECGMSLRACLDAELARQRQSRADELDRQHAASVPRPRYKRIGTLLVPVLPRGDDS